MTNDQSCKVDVAHETSMNVLCLWWAVPTLQFYENLEQRVKELEKEAVRNS
jgi:hypothetical protein